MCNSCHVLRCFVFLPFCAAEHTSVTPRAALRPIAVTLPWTRLDVGTLERKKMLETNRQLYFFSTSLLLPVRPLTTFLHSSPVLPSMTLISLCVSPVNHSSLPQQLCGGG